MNSFSFEVKKELSEINNLSKKNLVKAELKGYLATNSSNEFITSNQYNINRYSKLLNNVEENDLYGEIDITNEHTQNNTNIRKMLNKRGIKPEELPPAEDIRKLERKVKRQDKEIASQSDKFSNIIDEK